MGNKKLRVLITGATGMVGQGVLLECIDSSEVESIVTIGRHPVGISHPKVREIIHADFFNIQALNKELSGFNACFFCLGVSSAGMSEADYRKMTYELTMGFAKVLLPLNPELVFCYVSGAGTDSAEKSRMMWARVKGKTENGILELGFKGAYMFRPGFIQPMRGIKSRTALYNAIYFVLSPFYPLLKRMPGYVTNTITMGKAMIGVALKGYRLSILESKDINDVGAE